MIYLDSAATSFQKPRSVRQAADWALRNLSSPGRGAYPAAMRAAELCWNCRELAGEMFSCEPTGVAFTSNATHGLNIAIKSAVKPGSRVAVSGYEHNAVTRPLAALGAELLVADAPLFDDEAIIGQFEELIPRADVCICTHVSNVFGWILPVAEIARICREHDVPLIVDASQSAGSSQVDASGWGAAYVAMPGHKGLLGPQGTGLLLCSAYPEPLIHGGTGSQSASQAMPDFLPDRLEAGTHNMPGIAGLFAGMKFVNSTRLERILAHERRLRSLLERELRGVSGLEVFGGGGESQGGVLSVRSDRVSGEALAEKLSRRGIAVRPGLHCAPLAHQSAGTSETGTVRFSFSPFNTEAETVTAARAVREIVTKG